MVECGLVVLLFVLSPSHLATSRHSRASFLRGDAEDVAEFATQRLPMTPVRGRLLIIVSMTGDNCPLLLSPSLSSGKVSTAPYIPAFFPSPVLRRSLHLLYSFAVHLLLCSSLPISPPPSFAYQWLTHIRTSTHTQQAPRARAAPGHLRHLSPPRTGTRLSSKAKSALLLCPPCTPSRDAAQVRPSLSTTFPRRSSRR